MTSVSSSDVTLNALSCLLLHPGSTSSRKLIYDRTPGNCNFNRIRGHSTDDFATIMADISGVAYKDLLPVPDPEAISDPAKEETARTIHDGATASHELATSPTEETGLVQQDHDEEVKDLGWNEPKEAIPAPLVGGMDNEGLWVLVRRFDKVRFPYVANVQDELESHWLFSSKCTM